MKTFKAINPATREPQLEKPVSDDPSYAPPRLVELGDAAALTRYYSSGGYNDGSSDHPRTWWN